MKKIMCALVFLGFLSTSIGSSIHTRPYKVKTPGESLNSEIDKTSVKMSTLKYKLEQMQTFIK